jgi:hypothetical protein
LSPFKERNVKKALIAAIAILASAWAGSAGAAALVDVTVVNRATGERVPVYAHRGRIYVPGTPGAKYSLRITNKTGERVLAVASVDGINVITGETANPGQSGYVLDPWGSVDISGWRKSMSEVAAFVFTSLPDSYAARTDRPGNVGVIGVAAFREYQPPRRRPLDLQQPEQLSGPRSEANEAERPDAGSTAARILPDASKREEKLGTGHGEREASWASWTDFRRASDHPAELVSIWYDSRSNLIARGIIPGRPYAEPNPFPGFRFTPDPRG